MGAFIVTIIVGAVCIVLGISNMRGNISSLHSYHRHRVKEEEVAAFGKAVGIGTVIIGAGVSAYGAFAMAAYLSGLDVFLHIGTAAMIAGLAVGLPITFYAIIKYNKGLF